MKRLTKIWLIAAGALIALGLIVFAVVMALSGWDFTKLSDVTLETNTYEISESFTEINIDCKVADISVMPSEDGACRVVCSEDKDAKHSVSVKDVKSASLVSKGSTGSTALKNVIVGGKAEIERSTGGIELYRCDAESLDLETDTGDITATLLSGKDFDADSSTGDVSVPDGSSGGKCRVRTGTGSIDIKLVK